MEGGLTHRQPKLPLRGTANGSTANGSTAPASPSENAGESGSSLEHSNNNNTLLDLEDAYLLKFAANGEVLYNLKPFATSLLGYKHTKTAI